MEKIQPAFQDLIPDNHCFGCGPGNPRGLRIQSRWEGDEAVCRYRPKPHECAGPSGFLNGGVIATLVDCHCVCTAIADAYREEGRAIGSDPPIWCVTAELRVSYRRPTPIDGEVVLRAGIRRREGRKTLLACSLRHGGTECVTAEVVAVRVAPDWRAAG